MSDTQLIKDKLDIVDFIGEYVQLKPGGINHKGLCPFHREKSPSFMVNRERQSWKCFGCGKGGDIFSFVQEMEGMEFVEALKYLANRAGVMLTNTRSEVNSSQKNRIKDINVLAARLYHHILLKTSAGKPALAYLERRGVTRQTIEEWQIGFVPDQWDVLTKFLLKKGHSIDDIVAAGLTIMRDGADQRTGRGFYDRFRGRIMFPISDIHGNVVGFTGRVLVETEQSGGKYVNTPQTLVYDKSRVVFALDKAKQEIRTKGFVVMVEGQMDVIACHQAGMKQVVATSGTAMTDEQIKLLKRYANELRIAFDADSAGESAAKRGIHVAIKQGMGVRVIQIPAGKGKDPDECLKQNPEVWFTAVEQARDIMEWYFERALLNGDLSDPKQKQQVADVLMADIALIPYAIERDHWLGKLSEAIRVDIGVLREDIRRFVGKPSASSGAQGKQGGIENVVSETSSNKKAFVPQGKVESLLERLFMLLLRHPSELPKVWSQVQALEPAVCTTSFQGLYELIKMQYTTNNSFSIDHIRESISEDNSIDFLDHLLMKSELDFFSISEKEVPQELERIIGLIGTEWKKERRTVLQQAIEAAERSGDKDRLQLLLAEFQAL